ncbi:ABC transporter substrate-binding protein [Piscinibacter sp. HJYY11]|uniref:ABC transporter substrate-binding protein n=1 Tax=Piscinibacter sp. HJYY11 TaxID=2801333 RepID=UPI00191E3DC5|nr:ABC transporter substrate-binding protein [Piscinibacter sp. HJYY11]MBL0727214.1 ABC transporter substrate-binding protein [Piscinibacter sp. HJYY11]
MIALDWISKLVGGRLTARRGVAALVCLAAFPAHGQGVTLTQVADFSGRGKAVAVPASEGAKACIAAHNASPAGAASPARLVLQDDKFDAATSRALAEASIRSGTTAFINSLGADTTNAIAEVAGPASVPVVGAITGATSVRARKHATIFFIRSSIVHEGRHAVRHLHTLGLKRIAVFHTDDAYGRDGLEAVKTAMAELALSAPKAVSYVTSQKDAGPAPDQLADAEAVVMFGSGPVMADFVKRMRAKASPAMLIAASAANMTALVDAVGVKAARGVGYLRSVPSASERSVVGRQFRQIWKAHGTKQEPTSFHLEGCIAAQVALRVAQTAGTSPQKMLRALQNTSMAPFGDFRLDFRNPRNEGSSWVSIAVINHAGVLLD